MPVCIALLRGINVGRARRVPMADLRQLVEGLGHRDVKTLLNSGNVVFKSDSTSLSKIRSALESAIETRFGFPVAVVVMTAAELNRVIQLDPFADKAVDPSRYLVAFAANAKALAATADLSSQDWGEDAFALNKKQAYLWCADGVLASRLMKEFERVNKKAATCRNWATLLKLQLAAGGM